MKKIIFIAAFAVAACNRSNTKNTAETAPAEQTAESAATELLGKEWKLTELNGAVIQLDTTFPKTPFLVFDGESSRVSGNAGCNGIGGGFELEEAGSITISHIAGTQMACPNLEIEQEFLDVLANVKSFHVEGNALTLNNAAKEAIARFELKVQ